jgi:C4-type Zn-finger protein
MEKKSVVVPPEKAPFFDQVVWCPKCQKETRHRLANAGYMSPSPYFGGYFSMPAVVQCEECKTRHT